MPLSNTAAPPDLARVMADLYDGFTRQHVRYQRTSAALVGLCGDLVDCDVVDLGCGTGVTSAAILEATDAKVRLTSVDASEQMLNKAKHNLAGRSVRWLHGDGEQLATMLDEPVDAVLANASIWHMDAAAVAGAVASVLRPQGRFAFNIGRDHIDPDYPLLAVARRIAGTMRETRATLGPRPPRKLLLEACRAEGLTLERAIETIVSETSDSRIAFLRQPGSTVRMLPGIAYLERIEILERAFEQIGPPPPAEIRWAHLLLRKE